MSQYVIDIKQDRATPVSMEECAESGTEMGRYDLCLAMAYQARRIQRRRVREIIRGDTSYTNQGKYKNPYPNDPVTAAMQIYKDA